MGIRFLLFSVVFSLLVFSININVYASDISNYKSSYKKDKDKDWEKDLPEDGIFASVADEDEKGNKIAKEFGTPQKPVDEKKPDGKLTPIEQYNWNNPENLIFTGNSNVKFHFFNFKNNATLELKDSSKVDLQLHNNTTDITFNIIDGVATYLGGSKGKINVFLPKVATASSSDYLGSHFYSTGNVDNVNIQGEGNNNERGGTFYVGYKDDKNAEQPASITIQHLKGNGKIYLAPDSKLVIKDYEVKYDENGDWGDKLQSIQNVNASRGEVIFDTKVYIQNLEVENAIFNKESKLETVTSVTSGEAGKHIFNANSTITKIDKMNNLVMNKGVYIVVDNLNEVNEANLAKGTTLELKGNQDTTTAKINKLQGEGTLHINAEYVEGGNHNLFNIKDVNLNTLILDGKETSLMIENTGVDYTNTIVDQKTGDTISEETVIRRIKNITKSKDAEAGDITVKGTVIFENIDYLNKLQIGGDESITEEEENNINLIIKKVNSLKELELNKGKLFLYANQNNYVNPALKVDTVNLKGGELISVIQDTNTIKNKNTYTILSSDKLNIDAVSKDSSLSSDNFKTTLPDWYKYNYYLSSDKKSIMLDAERLAKYRDIILKSSYSNNYNVKAMSSYFDDIINSQIPLNISAKTFTYIDLLSENNYDSLSKNLNSLVPLSKDKYIKTAHFSLKESLDVSKRKGLENKKPFGIWDKRKELKTPNSKVWFVGSVSDGRYGSVSDNHSSRAYQFGYNLYNWVSNNNKEEYAYTIVGGFSKGSIDNPEYKSDMFSLNIGNTLNYRDENDIVKLSFLYGISLFDTERDYFISKYNNKEDFTDLNKSRLKSSPQTHEFLFDIQYSHEIFVEYLKTFSRFDNVILTPRVYITPSLFIGSGYSENGDYSSLESNYYVSAIFESGLGFDISKGIHFSNNYFIKGYVGIDTFYRYYNFPTNNLHFKEVSDGVSVDNNAKWSGVVVDAQTGVAFEYKKSQFSAFYKREIAKNYYQNIFGISYKYSF